MTCKRQSELDGTLGKHLLLGKVFSFRDPLPRVFLCYEDADWKSDKTSRRWTSGGVVTVGGGVVNCWAKKQKSVALLSWESELFSAVT